MKKMFYDEDIDLSILTDKKIGVIGYGIQGKAQALNLRDSGLEVRVGNRKDMYTQNIIKANMDFEGYKDLIRQFSKEYEVDVEYVNTDGFNNSSM